ncbi:unnamed protein product, partial [Scytosiphon promiscuus]
MVQKWAVGAMINISGSIAINLGTNLMKLSHKMEKGETRQKADDNTYNDPVMSGHKSYALAASSEADLEAAECMINPDNKSNGHGSGRKDRRRHPSRFRPSPPGGADDKAHGVEMTAIAVDDSDGEEDPRDDEGGGNGRRSSLEKATNGSVRATAAATGSAAASARSGDPARENGQTPGRRGRGGGGGFARSGGFLGHEDPSSSTDSPSPARGSDAREAHDPAEPPRRSKPNQQRSRGRKPTAVSPPPATLTSSKGNGHRDGGRYARRLGELGEGGGGGGSINRAGEYDEEHRGVRRRSSSSAGGDESGVSGGGGGRGGLGSGAGGHGARQEFEWKSKALWYAGAFLLVAGSLVNFASFGFAPQSLLASLGSVQFISNVVFGKVILREVVTRRIIVGTATIILGNTLTLCFSPHQDDNFSTGQLKAFYDLEYNALLLLELAFALAMHATYKSFKRSKEEREKHGGKPRRYSDLVMPLAYAICSAIIGTQSVVNAKCLSELLTLTFQGDNQMGSPFTYLVIAIWLGTTIFWLVRMNRALAMFHGLFIIPALQVFWTFFSVIGGGFYFEEFHTLHVLGGLGFAVGVLYCPVAYCCIFLAPRSEAKAEGAFLTFHLRTHGEPSDLTRMLRLEADESPAPSPVHGRGPNTPSSRGQAQALDTSLEAGDEEIDWDHTRMLSIGFFPSISTDQDVAKMGMGKLANNSETLQPGARIAGAGASRDRSAGHLSQSAVLLPPWSKPKDTPPRPNSPSSNKSSLGSPFSSAGDAAVGDRGRGVEGGSSVCGDGGSGGSVAAARPGSREETE